MKRERESGRGLSSELVAWVAILCVLALAGCGGSSSSDDSGEPSDAGSAQTHSASAESNAEEDSSSTHERSGDTRAGGDAQTGETGSHAEAPGNDQGVHIRPPKGAPEPHITPEQRENATVADMILRSPVSVPGEGRLETLPATYTCDGKNTSPALRWNGVPAGTQELALFAMNVQPVEEKLFFDWAVAGIDPGLTEIETGKLPKGAVVGRNSFGQNGYQICPQAGGEIYMFALFALPARLSPERGFDPHDLRQEALDASGNVGLLPLTYVRG